MSQKFTAEEVLSAMDEAIFALEFLPGGDGILAKERLQKARSAYAATLSKPADSGRVSESMVCRMFEVMNAHFESEFQSLNKLSDEDEATAKRGIRAGLAALAAQGQGDAVAASPAGVPELHGWTLKLMRDRDGDMSIWACDPDGSSVHLAAAPSAPEGE